VPSPANVPAANAPAPATGSAGQKPGHTSQ